MRRRTFITAAGSGLAASTVALAGCTGAGKPSSVSVRIDYTGEWSGAIAKEGSTQSISGSGPKVFTWDEEIPDTVSANAQKQDDGTEKLVVQIMADGDVVKESSTTAEYGVASVTHSF